MSAFPPVCVTGKISKTEFLNTVQGQCAPGILPSAGVTGAFGGETSAVLASTTINVAAPGTAMNQLGTVYATKRRRRNGKRFVTKYFSYTRYAIKSHALLQKRNDENNCEMIDQ